MSIGIPYRRGYLFYGPPGTGKTSLSFALAGIFGLDIYCISLMEVGLTESDLNKLFTTLPRRCIVLLEDIDSAGLRRTDDTPATVEAADSSSDGTSSEDGVKVDAVPKLSGASLQIGGIKSLISLSGLLNTIDGAASHEGRVLIMTTNHPEKLDPALIRPGRVDLQVQFTLATRSQIRDIFKRMYTTKASEAAKPSAPSTQSRPPTPKGKQPSLSSSREDEEFLEMLAREPVLDVLDLEQLGKMAEEFAEKIPPGAFSPAEIQGFLLTRKKEPRRALAEVDDWKNGVLKKKGDKGRT